MKITKELLEDVKASDGHLYKLYIPKTREGKDRKSEVIDVLKEAQCENIIHVGACGHLNKIKKQLDNNVWFHDKICASFKNVIGTDINSEAIDFLTRLGKKGLYDKDATVDGLFLKEKLGENAGGGKSAILLPEVLEHIEDPFTFLRKLKENFEGFYIIITVPNAFGTWVISNVFKHNYELINSDHKYQFTPFTLLKAAALAGIETEELRFCDYTVAGKILRKPIISNTLLLKGKL